MSLIPVGSAAIVLGAITALFGLLWSAIRVGAAKERQAEEARTAEGYLTTRKATDDADVIGDDPDLGRRWLQSRNPDQP